MLVDGEHYGCPAHAGIDPASNRRGSPSSWLPRTRGDRPAARAALDAESEAAPHTRGSTLATGAHDVRRRGCPAHAGIDLGATRISSSRSGLPRTRGDRPRVGEFDPTWTAAAPHTRGSTFLEQVGHAALRGCPAHAGIDPAASPSSGTVIGLPRTRGDRPSAMLAPTGSD